MAPLRRFTNATFNSSVLDHVSKLPDTLLPIAGDSVTSGYVSSDFVVVNEIVYGFLFLFGVVTVMCVWRSFCHRRDDDNDDE